MPEPGNGRARHDVNAARSRTVTGWAKGVGVCLVVFPALLVLWIAVGVGLVVAALWFTAQALVGVGPFGRTPHGTDETTRHPAGGTHD